MKIAIRAAAVISLFTVLGTAALSELAKDPQPGLQPARQISLTVTKPRLVSTTTAFADPGLPAAQVAPRG